MATLTIAKEWRASFEPHPFYAGIEVVRTLAAADEGGMIPRNELRFLLKGKVVNLPCISFWSQVVLHKRQQDPQVYPLASEARMNHSHRTMLTVSASVLLAGSVLFSHQQGELAGIRGIPVAGHDTVAAIEIVGTNRLSGFQNMRERFRSNGAELRLGLPLESRTLCHFKEVLRDLLREKGYPDAKITHERKPTYGNPRDVTLVFTVIEGKRTGQSHATGPWPTPAERCSR